MIYIPIFVNIVLLLLFDYMCLSFSLFSFPYIIRPVCRIAWSDSPPCFGPSLFTDAANATAFPYDGRFLRFPAELFVIYSRRIKARTGTVHAV